MKVKIMLAAVFLFVFLAVGSGYALPAAKTSPALPEPSIPADVLRTTIAAGTDKFTALPDFTSVIAEVKPSVVAVNTEISIRAFGRQFTQEGAGSGWIIDENGLIVTNGHVVEGASTVTVTLEDGRVFPAEYVVTDNTTDLAVIKIGARNLPALDTGSSSELQVGEWVVAIGNALGLGTSATKGIVSALGISVSVSAGVTMDDLIQTDAAVNPGNSGGPLVNMRGQVVGINTIKVSDVGVEGMSYAISFEKARAVIDRLISNVMQQEAAL